ncbi:hypothetical protein HGRIS_013067 [Hohenbuehelia grisea]|uniref:Uncharacterized protein n=1 Tax=Hohenbuehelia grisea TaxID=104357 RepID=A0ABR3IUK7_9AGAR
MSCVDVNLEVQGVNNLFKSVKQITSSGRLFVPISPPPMNALRSQKHCTLHRTARLPLRPSRSFSRDGFKSSTSFKEPDHPIFPEATFSAGTGAWVFMKRFAKLTALGMLAVGATGWTAFEGAHLWVEHVELAAEMDDEVRRWEWDVEPENWASKPDGGTDPGLGYKARHAARAAWMAVNWGTGQVGSIIASERGSAGAGMLNVVDARLAHSEEFLSTAISLAEGRAVAGKLRPHTLTSLLARHGAILERMGSPEYLRHAVTEYERAWAGSLGKGLYAAHIAMRLGDLCRRLGRADDALTWWDRSVKLATGGAEKLVMPSSPLAQRILTSTYISLSAFYATSGRYQDAQRTEEGYLNLLRSITPPQSLATASSPQALHALFLLHRSSLLSIHLAEVLYAQQHPVSIPIQWLTSAADSSERVAFALTGVPLNGANSSLAKSAPPSTDMAALTTFTQSKSMRKPANSLLRDARRTAAEAWNLMGLLYESTDAGKALECFERAVSWAGIGTDDTGRPRIPAEGTLSAEWKLLLKNYARAREAVERAAS